MSTWRLAEDGEFYLNDGTISVSYEGGGVFQFGSNEAPSEVEIVFSGLAEQARIQVLGYNELPDSNASPGNIYNAPYFGFETPTSDSRTYNWYFGGSSGNIPGDVTLPVSSWVDDGDMPIEIYPADYEYMFFRTSHYTSGQIPALSWFIRVQVELLTEGGGGGGECFWTDLNQVLQVCGDPGPGPDPGVLLDVPVLLPSGLNRPYNAPRAALTLGFTMGPVLDPGVSAIDPRTGVPYSNPNDLDGGNLYYGNIDNIALTHIAFLGANVGSHELPDDPYSQDPEFYSRLEAAIMQMPVAGITESGWGCFTQYDEMPAVLARNGSLLGVGRDNDSSYSGFITSEQLAQYISESDPDYWPTVGDLFAVRAEDNDGRSAILIMVIAESDYNDHD